MPSVHRILGTRRVATSDSWPLHNSAASRAAEQAALAEVPPHVLMERAGLAVAQLAQALAPHAKLIQVWAGPGNNGGDGLVAARHLHDAGRRVQVNLVGSSAHAPADAQQALRRAHDAGVQVGAWQGQACAGDLHIDALLGLGAARAPAGPMAAAISAINSQTTPVLAVDLPSGLHADTGAVLGDAAVRASATLALLTLKPGCHTGVGRDHAGALWLDTLGARPPPPTAWLGGPGQPAPRPQASHKGNYGDVAVVGGAPGMVGAVWLAARAALAAGAGRVLGCPLDSNASGLDPGRPELMHRSLGWLQQGADLSQGAVVCGCGGGDAIRQALPMLLSRTARLVLDADALNVTAADSGLQGLLGLRASRGLLTLLTPHPLEAARLLACTVAEVQRDRLAAASELAARWNLTVVLKGSGSVIATPGGTPVINATGNAALATAGTGDVLAGWAGGLWAQAHSASAQAVACQAAWLHGHAADLHAGLYPHTPLRAADLVEAMAKLAT